MGRWRITIDGTGCHHNGRREIDADLAAKDFVRELKQQGHALEAARFEMLGAIRTSDNVYDAQAVASEPPHPSNIDFLAAPAVHVDETGG